jgi:hypothetical protein
MQCNVCYEWIDTIDRDENSQFNSIEPPCGHACCQECWGAQYERAGAAVVLCPVCRQSVDRWLTRYYKPDYSITDSDIENEDGAEVLDFVQLYNPRTKERGFQFLTHDRKVAAPWVEMTRIRGD